VFDEVAELYARVRPTYPAALVDLVIGESGLQPGGRILELGSGPGNASVLFSGRGYHLLCLEPGERLADVARRRLAGDSNARVEVTTFEAWPIEPEAFDLVYAAQSFHWMDPAVRFSKTARALKPNGTLAIFANRPLHGTGRVDGQIREAYAAHAPAIDARWIGHNTRDHFLELFAAASEFRAAQWREYAWGAEYSRTEYVDLLRTHSDHRLLPESQLSILLDAIGEAIDANGGRFSVDYLAVLCWAHRAPP
jgi:SAM-dependent methyltransferase